MPAAMSSVLVAEAARKAARMPRLGSLRAMSTQSSGGQTRIHRLIEEHGTVVMPGVHDALSACVAQKVGFDAAFVSGFGVSASHLGKPDFGLLTYLSASLSVYFAVIDLELVVMLINILQKLFSCTICCT